MNFETKQLNTNRLVIKRGTINDFLKVYEYNFNKLKDVDGIFKLEKQNLLELYNDFDNDIDNYYKKIEKAHIFDWIIYKQNNAIGNILTSNENLKDGTVEVTFNLHPSFWGNGYIREALKEVLKFLFDFGYNNVICKYSDGNYKAKRVLERLGFLPYNIEIDALTSENGNLLDNYVVIMNKKNYKNKENFNF